MAYLILIVDDTQDTRELIRFMLELEGYRVVEASNGLDAVEIVRRERPDAIVMDMSLPAMDGCQTTRRIRREPGMAAVPIIACTAYNRWEWRGKAIVAGCTEFVAKPVEPEGLISILARYLP